MRGRRAAPDVLAAWLDGLLTITGSETGGPWDDTPASDILVFLTAIQAAADGVPLRDELLVQGLELAEQFGFDSTFSWPERRIADTVERLAAFGVISGGEFTELGRGRRPASGRSSPNLARNSRPPS